MNKILQKLNLINKYCHLYLSLLYYIYCKIRCWFICLLHLKQSYQINLEYKYKLWIFYYPSVLFKIPISQNLKPQHEHCMHYAYQWDELYAILKTVKVRIQKFLLKNRTFKELQTLSSKCIDNKLQVQWNFTEWIKF